MTSARLHAADSEPGQSVWLFHELDVRLQEVVHSIQPRETEAAKLHLILGEPNGRPLRMLA